MFTLLSCLVRVHEPPARAGERRTDRAARQPGLGGDVLVREPRIPQQQDLAITRRQLLERGADLRPLARRDRKSTRLNSSHGYISYAVFCLKKKKTDRTERDSQS